MNDAPKRQVVAVGQIARDLVLKVAVIPEQGNSGPVTERLEMLGGKGANQAVGMARLGMHVSLIAAVGDDKIGARLIEQAGADTIDTSYIAQRPQTSTALIVSIVEEGG